MTLTARELNSNPSILVPVREALVVLRNRAALLGMTPESSPHWGAFALGLAWPVGAKVRFDFTIPSDWICVQLHGLVRWRRDKGTATLPVGAWVEFLDGRNRPLPRQRLEEVAANALPRARRFLVQLRGFVIGAAGACEVRTIDLSRSGARLQVRAPRYVSGDEVAFRMRDHTGKPLELSCRVVREGRGWMATRLTGASDGDKVRYAELLRAIRSHPRQVETIRVG